MKKNFSNFASRYRRTPIANLLIKALCLVLMAGSSSGFAQFSGPTLTSAAAVNRPVVLTTDPAILYPKERDIHLAPGDVISVRIYGAPEYMPQAQVTLDGSVQLPLAGVIPINGLTIHAAQNVIAKGLVSAGMYRDPQVSLQLIESPNQIATVTGEVRAIVPLKGSKRLYDVLATAGGFPITASHVITINRVGQDEPIVVDLGTDPATSEHANIPIFAGDTIVMAKTGVVYMLGAFKTQGAVPLQQNTPLTLMQAAALSGGPGFEGKYADMRLIRTIGLERKVVKIDMKRVMNGKDPDPVLQVDDIVLLPSSVMKSAIKSGGLGTLIGFASILVIAAQN